MRLDDARSHLREVDGTSLRYMKEWGLGTIKRAIWTIENRVTSTKSDRLMAERINTKIYRGW